MNPTYRQAISEAPVESHPVCTFRGQLPKILFAALLITAVGPTARAAEVAVDKITAAVSQLGSRRFEDREKAFQLLESIGEPALPLLERAAQSADPEVRRRAGQLRQLVQRQVDSARLIVARTVRLSYRDVPLASAVADFNQRTGFAVLVQGDPKVLKDRKVTLDTGEVTLWQALDQFCRSAGLAEWRSLPESTRAGLKPFVDISKAERMRLDFLPPQQRWAGGRAAETLLLVPAQTPALPCGESGGLRVRALPAGTAGAGELTCLLEICAQPGMDWRATQEVRIRRAVDEQGQHLTAVPMTTAPPVPSVVLAWRIAAMKSSEMYGNLTRADNRAVEVRLEAAARPSHRLRELEGSVIGRMIAPPQTAVTVDNILKASGETFRRDGTAVRVGRVKTIANDHVLLEVEIAHTPGENEAAGESQVFAGSRFGPGDLRLRDSAGKEYELVQGTTNPVPGNGSALVTSLTVLYRAGPGRGGPHTLVLYDRRPTFVEVPFRLESVPLP